MNPLNPPLIALMTDFGNDPYIGIMKGRILQINPFAHIMTFTNHIQNHNIRQCSFILLKSYQFFPQNTIFLVVVDPGVGSKRRAIAAKFGNYYFVGPDNGILTPIQKNEEITVVRLSTPEDASNTFHGRDVFAPAAAKLSQNYLLSELGSQTDLLSSIDFFLESSNLIGEVVFIDHFGNIITNIPYSKDLALNNQYIISTDLIDEIVYFRRSYFEGSDLEPFIIVSSFGTLEIALRNRKVANVLDIKPGNRIQIRPA